MRFGDHRAGLNSNIIDGEESKWKQQIELVELYDVGGHGAKVGAHLLEDGVLGEEAPLVGLVHCLGDGDKVFEVFLNLLHVLLDLAPRSLPHTRDLLACHLGGQGDEPGHQG